MSKDSKPHNNINRDIITGDGKSDANGGDGNIVALYFARSETAISQTAAKYGRYLYSIAKRITGDDRDAEECVNDTYLHAWNSIPPNAPGDLAPYLGRIARNAAFDRYRMATAEKRGGGEVEAVINELAGCVSDDDNIGDDNIGDDNTAGVISDISGAADGFTADESADSELSCAINEFLRSLPRRKRVIFMQRYWYSLPVSEIAAKNGMGQSAVKMSLLRMRTELKERLETL